MARQLWTAVHRAFCAADDAWGEELRARFGKRAGDVRYTVRGRGEAGSKLRALYEARDAARIAWERDVI